MEWVYCYTGYYYYYYYYYYCYYKFIVIIIITIIIIIIIIIIIVIIVISWSRKRASLRSKTSSTTLNKSIWGSIRFLRQTVRRPQFSGDKQVECY